MATAVIASAMVWRGWEGAISSRTCFGTGRIAAEGEITRKREGEKRRQGEAATAEDGRVAWGRHN